MKKKYQNGFFLFGIVVLVIMVTQLDFAEVWRGLQHAGYWFFAVVVLWAFLYIFNTTSWYIIIKSQTKGDDKRMVPFWYLYKIRHLVENAFARLKHYRAIATRYDKLKRNYLSTVLLGCIMVWLPL